MNIHIKKVASSIVKPKIVRREFFWSKRNLLVHIWREGEQRPYTHEVLGVDRDRCIFSCADYGNLIVDLLNEYYKNKR